MSTILEENTAVFLYELAFLIFQTNIQSLHENISSERIFSV